MYLINLQVNYLEDRQYLITLCTLKAKAEKTDFVLTLNAIVQYHARLSKLDPSNNCKYLFCCNKTVNTFVN